MKIKDVLALAAADLGREDLVALVNDCAGSPSGELSSLLRCYHLVENEIALDYFPLYKEESLPVTDGAIPYRDFAFAPVEVERVTAEGRELCFEPLSDRLRVEGTALRARVRYRYSPAEKAWTDDSEFSGKISARLLSFGVASEFCLSAGQFGEAATWEKKYREALKAAHIVRKRLVVRSRRWA